MYEAPFAGRLEHRSRRCAALLLALGCLQACSSGEDTRPNDPPVQNPPPPPPSAAPATTADRRALRSGCTAVEHDLPGLGPADRRRHDLADALHEPDVLFAGRDAAGAERQLALVRRRAGRRRAHLPDQQPARRTRDSSTSARASPVPGSGAGSEMGLLGMAFHPEFPARTRACSCRTRRRQPRLDASRRSARRTTARRSTRAPSSDPADRQPARRTITTAATSRSARTDCSTSASATAAAAATSTATPATASASRRCSARCCASTSMPPARRRTRSPPTNPFFNGNADDKCPAGGPRQRRTAPRSTPGASAIRGAGASIAATASCGSATSARATWEEVDHGHARRQLRLALPRRRARLQQRRHHGCGAGGLIDPVAEYDRTQGFSITGGYVYRGTQTHEPGRPLPVRRFRLGPHLGVDRRERADAARADAAARHELQHLVVRPGERRRAVRRPLRRHAAPASCSTRAPAAATLRRAISAQTGCVSASDPQQPASGSDSLRDQRAVLVGRREQGSLARAARRPERSRCAPTATGTSRTARC